MQHVSLVEITDSNRASVLALQVLPQQLRFIGSTVDAMADALEFPDANPWPRAIVVGEQPVGFVMVSWNVVPDPPDVIGPWFLWKLLIDSRFQGLGYGRQTVHLITELVRAEGATDLLTSYVPGEDGPAGFYANLGFVDTGDRDADGEIIVSLRLHD